MVNKVVEVSFFVGLIELKQRVNKRCNRAASTKYNKQAQQQ
jgi:hypothetical protein